jgi:hypothetical protein
MEGRFDTGESDWVMALLAVMRGKVRVTLAEMEG